VAATGTSIVLTARIFYGMANRHALPPWLADVSTRYKTPAKASYLTAVLTALIVAVYLLASSVQSAFDAIINVSGQLFGVFYILTAIATMVYYRRRIFRGLGRFLSLFIFPAGAAVFLAWVQYKAMQGAPAPQNWSLAGVLAAGLALMLYARLGLRSPFFRIPRESDPGLPAGEPARAGR
jgi:amino acid transporter